MYGMLRGLWSYRGFVLSSIRNEFVTRFARSRLGGLWMIVNPLAQVAIYALILSNVLAAKLPGITNTYGYAIYLMAGSLAWNLFSEIINRYLNLFIEHGNLMKKMSFPRITLPVIVVGSSLLNNALLLVAMLLVFALLGQMPSLLLLWLIPLTMAVVALGVGIGLILGVLNVFIRDVGQVVPILLQILFWFTPIVYPATIIPSYLRGTMDLNPMFSIVSAYHDVLTIENIGLRSIIPSYLRGTMDLNPMFSIVSAYHDVLVYAKAPDLGEIWLTATISVCLMMIGLFMFRRAAPEMVDAL